MNSNYGAKMKIQAINNNYINSFSSTVKRQNANPKQKQDSFVSSDDKKSSFSSDVVMFLKKAIGPVIGINLVKPVINKKSENNEPVEDFHLELAQGIQDYFDETIPPENLTGILSPDKFREILPHLTTDNYICKPKNLESGVYCIDLDYETNYTKGGKRNIFDIMDNVARFADSYYEQTKKEFIFAIADRDTLESAKHVVRIIGENPDKYKHVKFLPACKVSYTHESPNSKIKYENSNFIVYGVNPFSSRLNTLFNKLSIKRKTMLINFITAVSKLYPEFSYQIKEFAKQNNFMYEKDYAISNLYWRAREYSEAKGEMAMKSLKPVPEDIIQDADDIINQLGKLYIGAGFEEFEGPDSNIDINAELNKTIKGIFEKYSTHIDPQSGELVSSAETIYSNLITTLNMEPQKPIVAFAAPYYLCHDFDNPDDYMEDKYPKVVEFMNTMRDSSNGMLTAFQSVVPMYDLDKDLSLEKVKKFNEYLRKNTEDFYEVGGSLIQHDPMPFC